MESESQNKSVGEYFGDIAFELFVKAKACRWDEVVEDLGRSSHATLLASMEDPTIHNSNTDLLTPQRLARQVYDQFSIT